MGRETGISWTDCTFNPWVGCTKVSPGCANCYAETLMDERWGKVKWGKGQPRNRTSEAYWKQPAKWNRIAEKMKTRLKVFTASLADIMDEEVCDEWRNDLFKVIADTPYLDWQCLTKRLEKAAAYLPTVPGWPLPNAWLGASVENQAYYNLRWNLLRKIPATLRFLSIEPQLGMIELYPRCPSCDVVCLQHRGRSMCCDGEIEVPDWIIVGGESGEQSRPFNLEWARLLLFQSRAMGIPFFFKQAGSNPDLAIQELSDMGRRQLIMQDRKGGNPAEWPEWLRIREFPNVETAQEKARNRRGAARKDEGGATEEQIPGRQG